MIWTEARWAPLRSVRTDLTRLVRSVSSKAIPVLGPARGLQAERLGVAVNALGSRKKPPSYDLLWAPRGFPFNLEIVSAEILVTDPGLYVLFVRLRPTGWTISTGTGLSEPSSFRAELWIHYVGTELPAALMPNIEQATFEEYRVRCRPFYPSSDRFSQVEARLSPAASRPTGKAALVAAMKLAEPDTRQAVMRLRHAGTLRLEDFETHTSERSDLSELQSAGLLRVWTEAGEQLVEPSPLASDLLNGNKWHSILVAESLVRTGIPEDQLKIEHELDGHEIDILANLLGNLSIFELKGGPFSVGHAYSLAAKMAMIQPDLVFVVSSGPIEERARRLLEREVLEERTDVSSLVLGYRQPPPPSVSFIEGTPLEPALNEAISSVHRRIAEEILEDALATGVLTSAEVLDQL